MRTVLGLILLALAGTEIQAQLDMQRAIERGGWKIYIRRQVWNDEIDPIAMSPFVPTTSGHRFAAILISCHDQKPTVLLQWPRLAARAPGQTVPFTLRIGAQSPRQVVLSDWQPGESEFIGRPPAEFDARREIGNAERIAFGPGYPPSPPDAAVIAMAGFQEAWGDMEKLCRGDSP
jgi:hypothetical protein